MAKTEFLNNQNETSFSVILWRCDVGDNNRTIELRAKFKFIKVTGPNEPNIEFYRTITDKYSRQNPRHGFTPLVSWDILQKYMNPDDSIVMEVEFFEIKPEPIYIKPEPIIDNSTICACCSASKDVTTLFRINCGHLYCDLCIERDLNIHKVCCKCGYYEEDLGPPQLILF